MTIVVGILGGIGSGKSTVAQSFARHGATVIDADEIAREVTSRAEIGARIRERFGGEVLDEGGRVDRTALAERVFGEGSEAARRDLEEIIHPAVRAAVREELDRARKQDAGVVVLDVPLLLESGYRESCDRLLFVRADRATRLARVAERGWSEEELARREAAQAPLDEKMRAADLVIDNEGDLEQVDAHVRDIVASLES